LKGDNVAKHAGAYKSEKRKKELLRLKKQEEKRQKRLRKDAAGEHTSGVTDQEGQRTEEDSASSVG
jgi:hypothetical protein